MGKGRSSKLTHDTRLYKWRTESQLPRVKREGWSKAGSKGGFGRPCEGGCNGDMPIITVPVSIPTEILYSRALGDWGKAMHDLGIISCNSANLLFKKIYIFFYLYLCACVFHSTQWKSEDSPRIGSPLPLCGCWGPMDTESMDKEPTSLKRSIWSVRLAGYGEARGQHRVSTQGKTEH